MKTQSANQGSLVLVLDRVLHNTDVGSERDEYSAHQRQLLVTIHIRGTIRRGRPRCFYYTGEKRWSRPPVQLPLSLKLSFFCFAFDVLSPRQTRTK